MIELVMGLTWMGWTALVGYDWLTQIADPPTLLEAERERYYGLRLGE